MKTPDYDALQKKANQAMLGQDVAMDDTQMLLLHFLERTFFDISGSSKSPRDAIGVWDSTIESL